MSNAIYTVKIGVGRGHPKVDYPVIDIARLVSGKVWHVVLPTESFSVLCGAKGGVTRQVSEIDAKVIRIDGHPVCGKCRARVLNELKERQ